MTGERKIHERFFEQIRCRCEGVDEQLGGVVAQVAALQMDVDEKMEIEETEGKNGFLPRMMNFENSLVAHDELLMKFHEGMKRDENEKKQETFGLKRQIGNLEAETQKNFAWMTNQFKNLQKNVSAHILSLEQKISILEHQNLELQQEIRTRDGGPCGETPNPSPHQVYVSQGSSPSTSINPMYWLGSKSAHTFSFEKPQSMRATESVNPTSTTSSSFVWLGKSTHAFSFENQPRTRAFSFAPTATKCPPRKICGRNILHYRQTLPWKGSSNFCHPKNQRLWIYFQEQNRSPKRLKIVGSRF